MTATVFRQSFMTQHPSLFTLINYCAIVIPLAIMFANAWFTTCDGFYDAFAFWLSHMKQWTITIFIWKRFCLRGYLTLMLTVVRRISKSKWMHLDTYKPSTLTSCISWRGRVVITNFGVRSPLTTNFNRWRHHPGGWGGLIVHLTPILLYWSILVVVFCGKP